MTFARVINAIPIPKINGMNNSKSISSISFSLNSLKLAFNNGFKKLNLILLIAEIRRSYIPVIKAIVPPETPGTISADPINNPLRKINIISFKSKFIFIPQKH